jgi:hypothetical protein
VSGALPAIQPCTVSSGMVSSSGSNQDAACAAFANRIWTSWRLAFAWLSR